MRSGRILVSGSKSDNDGDDFEVELEAAVGSDIDMEVELEVELEVQQEVEPEVPSHTTQDRFRGKNSEGIPLYIKCPIV